MQLQHVVHARDLSPVILLQLETIVKQKEHVFFVDFLICEKIQEIKYMEKK